MDKNLGEFDIYSFRSSSYQTILNHPDSRRKVSLFQALMPPGIKSILDVGGGSGWTTSILRKTHWVVTQDRDFLSLSIGEGDRIVSNAANLPFADHSFDLVLSSELLEHLPEDIYQKTRAEIPRVASQAILISLPYRENLAARMVSCPYCGAIFHIDHHLRAFSEQELPGLFNHWDLMEWHVFGELNEASGLASPDSKLPYRRIARQAVAEDQTVCPKCKRQVAKSPDSSLPPGHPRSRLRTGLSRYKKQLRKLLERKLHPQFLPQEKAPYWMAALFLPEARQSWVDSSIEDQLP